MAHLDRRRFLQASGLLAGGLATGLVAGCGSDDSGTGSGSADGGSGGGAPLQWWDHFNPLQDLHKEVFAEYTKDSGVEVQYTPQQTAKMGEALQLAKQSEQLPDMFTNVGLKLPIAALIKDGWYQPIELSEDVLGSLPDGAIVDGIHRRDGKLYTFPIFNTKQYWAAAWFNKELAEKAGLDPESPPETYEDFRAAAKAVQKAGGVPGWMLGLGQTPRLGEQIGFLAQAGGFEGHGVDGRLFKTGEIMYDHDGYVNAIEFWLSLKADGLLAPGTEAFDDKTSRTRWAAGQAGYYFDGPWCPGVVVQDLADFADKLEVGPLLVPEAGMPVTAYRPPQGGAFYFSGQSDRVEEVSELLGMLTTPEYFTKLAENMDQPPLDASVVEEADVHPTYKKLVGWFQESAFVAPVPGVQNPDIEKVNAERKPIEPDLGQTIQGLFTGDLGTDVRAALKDLSDRTNQEIERATKEAKKKGAKVEPEDYAFPDWQPRQDFTPDMYQS